MKTGHKVVTAEEVLVAKGEIDTVAMSSPVIVLRTPHTEKLNVCILVKLQNFQNFSTKISIRILLIVPTGI